MAKYFLFFGRGGIHLGFLGSYWEFLFVSGPIPQQRGGVKEEEDILGIMKKWCFGNEHCVASFTSHNHFFPQYLPLPGVISFPGWASYVYRYIKY